MFGCLAVYLEEKMVLILRDNTMRPFDVIFRRSVDSGIGQSHHGLAGTPGASRGAIELGRSLTSSALRPLT
jgi:hypothetical protein